MASSRTPASPTCGCRRGPRALSRLAPLFAALWVAGAGPGCAPQSASPRAADGVLDLSSWSFERQGVAVLEGDWAVCWGALVPPGASECGGLGGEWDAFPVPRLWSDAGVASPIGARGVATYRLALRLPPGSTATTLRVGAPMTAHRLFIDGTPRGGAGTVGTSPATTVAKLENRLYLLPAGASQVELLVHVANFEFRGGGLRRQSYVGLAEQVEARTDRELLLYGAFLTASVVVGLVFLAQFAFRRSETARGWFGLLAIGIGLRIVPASSGDLYHLLGGGLSFATLLRLEYLDTALVIFLGAAYLRAKVPGVMPPRLTQSLQIAALALVPVHLLAPLDTVLGTLPLLMALPTVGMGLALASYGRAFQRGVPGCGATLVASAVVTVGVVHDVVRTATGLGAPIEVFPYFVVAFMAVETQSLLQSFAQSFRRAEDLSAELEEANWELRETEEAVVRFVPFDLLRTLGKESIRDVRPGDHVEAEMSVLSCALDVEGGSGAESNFANVNRLVGAVDGVVLAHGGFVAQHLGSAVAALFPDAADAIEAALALQRLRREPGAANEPSRGLALSVGIASGPVVLGAVGAGESLSSVVLGATVQAAARMRACAEQRAAGVVVCEATRERLGPSPKHALREIAAGEDAQGATRAFELSQQAR